MERRAIVVEGIVQGVGFRPFVRGLAARLGLAGFVMNDNGSVRIEVEGDGPCLDSFLDAVARRPPPLARIDRLVWQRCPPRGDDRFCIRSSTMQASGPVFFSPDIAVCADCLHELFDPADRRYRYPFLNCTHCGPRLTIVTGAPYDRERTSMAAFPMCRACRAEYDDPGNRRFHAQPIACPTCGPSLEARRPSGERIAVADPLAVFVSELRAGRIGALKGLGGYHLACDAGNAAAVAELRRRKQRDEKPFAIMVQDLAAAEALCEVNRAERGLLRSPRCPIVLLRKRSGLAVAEAVAPGNPFLGVMLPYTPLHHLLLRGLEDRPLVMTSGNRADEPIATGDADALRRLADIADIFLTHHRPIHVRCDDSVTRVVGGRELPLRRSRGYAPQPVRLPHDCPRPILAVGGQLKGCFALGRGRHAFLSHHLGDLDHLDAHQTFVRDIALYEQLFQIAPEILAHDLHPDYASTRYAQRRAAETGLEWLAVQHHHAHLASCMAEHDLAGPVLGVIFDGAGYGNDGAVWGGEFLIGDYRQYRRAAHFRYVGMPGGEQAIREPWRMAVAYLRQADWPSEILQNRISPAALSTVARMLQRGVNTPLTSSAGRLFDAVASLAGVRDRVTYEGQAAMELEWLASSVTADGAYPFGLEETPEGTWSIDVGPLIRAVAADGGNGVEVGRIARRFHSAMVEIIAEVCGRLRRATELNELVLSGGVFLNALLTREVTARLEHHGFRVYRHGLVPPGDGGIALGQLAIAALV